MTETQILFIEIFKEIVMAVYLAPGVYTNVSDQTVDTNTGTGYTSCAVVVVTNKGPINKRVLCNTPSDYINTFGNLDPTVGIEGYWSQITAAATIRGCQNMYVTRVVNGALYGGVVLLQDPVSHNLVLNGLQAGGVEDPYATDFYSGFFVNNTMLLGIFDYAPGVSDVKVTLSPNTSTSDGGIWLNVYSPSSTLSPVRYNVSLVRRLNSMGEQMFIEDYVNSRSTTIVVKVNPNFVLPLADTLIHPIVFPATTSFSSYFAGGSVGGPVGPADIIAGYNLYNNVGSAPIDIFVNAGWNDLNIKQELLALAASSNGHAIIDVPMDLEHDSSMVADYRTNTLNVNSRSGQLACPYHIIGDSVNNTQAYAPASGFIAALMCKSDNSFGPYLSPAGMTRGDISLGQSPNPGSSISIIGLRTNYSLNDRNIFSQCQVNPVLNFPGYGPKLFGDSTLQSVKSAFQYISVSRMIDYVVKEANASLLFSVFDPNDQTMRDNIVAKLTNIVKPIQTARGLVSYTLVCDASNNPLSETSKGIGHVYVGIVPMYSTRIIALDLALTEGSVTATVI